MYIANNGGIGLALPYNSLLLLCLAALMFTCGKKFCVQNQNLKTSNRWLATGILLLCVPLFWDRHDLRKEYLWHVFTLIMAFIGYVLLSRIKFDTAIKRKCLQLILLLTVLQSCIGLIQAFFPTLAHQWYEYDWLRNSGRPIGIFQQVNLLGSFCATGIGCGTWLYLTTESKSSAIKYLISLILCGFVLVLTQSRTGLYGCLFTLIILFALTTSTRRRQWKFIIFATASLVIVLGTNVLISHINYVSEKAIVADTIINGGQSMQRTYSASNNERLNIVKNTLSMIMTRPFSGWGYGNFEHAFSLFAQHHQPFPTMFQIPHPHNEFLYVWVEGGITAAIGLLILLMVWLYQLCQLRGEQLALALLPLPLLLHCMLEYPFYQSQIHLALFILLIRFAAKENTNAITQKAVVSRLPLMSGVILAFLGGSSLYAGVWLTHFERIGFVDMPMPLPWYTLTQGSRREFDGLVGLLIRYNTTKDDHLLQQFEPQAEHYLAIHNDGNLQGSLSSITRINHQSQQIKQVNE